MSHKKQRNDIHVASFLRVHLSNILNKIYIYICKVRDWRKWTNTSYDLKRNDRETALSTNRVLHECPKIQRFSIIHIIHIIHFLYLNRYNGQFGRSRHLQLLGHVYGRISENCGFAAAGWTHKHGGTIQILGFVPQALQIASVSQIKPGQSRSLDIRKTWVTVGCRASLGASHSNSMCFPQ